MINDHEWNIIREKAFPSHAVKAPPFLWTRLLASIESEEIRRASVWWMQWRWMNRVTVVVGLLVSLGAYYLFQNSAIPLDIALDGRTNQQEALRLATTEMSSVDESAILIVGLDS